ncbi:YggS family pyridoxal phosphate-dependent enzyme [Trichocoleus sp. FACHB-262]|uniref:YggS family pyridoxal phosphate-dependent enzyme n=1 Tax=Trichocoleus sp. FACHB-262 TaxID=2692869 RepID=UPI001683FD4D|nr:YggS family pyridoxal phosphate-dependent enzyme [Trichocoleus sp. FACHB-262]MBD2119564.1 YggS family pyridoxal phosphate-dependent enzyme [Trichocoleus sp. FACHB-262]
MTSSQPSIYRDRIASIQQSLPPAVKLIAVTKQVPVAAMRVAYAAGVRDFGESRIQETETKQAELQDLPDITWHLIGRLQSNKAQKALELFQWIHSVDCLKLAQRLDRLAEPLLVKPQVCLQVKLLPDPNKTGWTVDELWSDLPQLDHCHNLKIQGLMTIPPLGLSESDTLTVFQQAQELAEKIRQQSWANIQMAQLSMGMSNDYRLAVQAGATMIRLGTILFGERGI